MKRIKIKLKLLVVVCASHLIVGIAGAQNAFLETKEKNSPAIYNQENGSVTLDNRSYVVRPERIGKKIAIRSLTLFPSLGFSNDTCALRCPSCYDTFEAVFISVEVQSIWSEPVLITASNIRVVAPKKNIKLGPGMTGDNAISQQITRNNTPQSLLLQPGEIKRFTLEAGMRMVDILDFFKGDVLCDPVDYVRLPFANTNLGRIKDFNRFLTDTYGGSAAIRITIFEKDYQPLLSSLVRLNQSSSFFSHGDVARSSYSFQADGFIGEVLNILRGGTERMMRSDSPHASSFQDERENFQKKAPVPALCNRS